MNKVLEIKSYNEVAQRHGDNATQTETLLQWHTTEQLEASLLNIFNKRRIQSAIEVLKSLKFISVYRNPNPRYAFDKTKHFLFHPNEVHIWLKNCSLKKLELSLESDEAVSNDLSMEQNEVIDSDDLHQSITTNCTDGHDKNNQRLIQIDPAVRANCTKQYTKNTYQNYLQKQTTR